MDDHEGKPQPSGFHLNGLLPDQSASVTRVLDTERWSQAEKRVAELIAIIQPNQASENRRNAIQSYMKRLIMECLSCQVFACGSVPLDTYLPDGDIDLIAFSKSKDLEETWSEQLKEVLEKEMKREDAEFRLKEVQIIPAKIKIVKCIVENIVVDISFNRLSGLYALCYLEEVDNLINNNHLFKRSIILIKAWCYYESRTLGGSHSLFSTYALETLVLYIFLAFNNSFAGPLEVLYRFLEFISKFDWNNFCISLWGPVHKSSSTDMAVDPPRTDVGELSLSKSVYACIAAHNVFPLEQGEPNSFPWLENFNIIDPLLTNNNLGTSVNKGSFFRILGAFSSGAKKLAALLDCPIENIITSVNPIFDSTWKRFGNGYRLDAPTPEINVPAVFHAGSQKVYANTTSSMASYQNPGLRNISSDERSRTVKGRGSRSGHLWNQTHDKKWFARPHSTSELKGSRRNLDPQVFNSHSARCPTEDQFSSGQHLFHQSSPAANPCGDFGLGYTGFRMYQPRQHYIFRRHVSMPANFSFGQQPHLLAPPFRYDQMIPLGMAQPNIPASGSRWVANMPDLQNLAPLTASQSYPGVAMASNQEERTEPGASNLTSTEFKQQDGGDGVKKS